MTAVRYVVPGKPVGVNRPGGGRGGRVPLKTKTPEQRAFAEVLAFYGLRARVRARWETTKDRVEVEIRIFFADKRPDTDAPVKAILDSLEVSRPKLRRPGAAFLANDRQVRRYLVERGVDRERPRIEITIGRVGEVFSLGTI